MILLVKAGPKETTPEWQAHFREFAPKLDVRWWDDPDVAPEDVSYALVYQPDLGWLARLKNLRLILSSASGVGHITRDPDWPSHLKIVKMGADETGQRMGEFVLLAALGLVRDLKRLLKSDAEARWDYFETPRCAADLRAGVMGLGNVGAPVATMLAGIGFEVAGWSRKRKAIAGIRSFAGEAEFPAFLSRSDILVCLLPDTPETAGILNRRTLALLPENARVINVARGAHLVTADLLAALDAGHLAGAWLDVFEEEPLPPESPLWRHPKLVVSPHLASVPSRRARARYAAAAIAAFERGEDLKNLFDPERGY